MTSPDVSSLERVARAIAAADYGNNTDEFWLNPNNNPWLMQERDEWDNDILIRLGREGYRRHARAAIEAHNTEADALREALDRAIDTLAAGAHLIAKYTPDHHWLSEHRKRIEELAALKQELK